MVALLVWTQSVPALGQPAESLKPVEDRIAELQKVSLSDEQIVSVLNEEGYEPEPGAPWTVRLLLAFLEREDSPVVASRVEELAALQLTPVQIADILNEEGEPPPGNGPWTPVDVESELLGDLTGRHAGSVGKQVDALTTDGATVRGQLVEVTPEDLVIETDNGPVRIGAEGLAELRVVEGEPRPRPKEAVAPTPAPAPRSAPVPVAPQESQDGGFAAGMTAGRAAARGDETGAWFGGGLAGGCLLSGLGCVGVTALAYGSRTNPALPGEGISADYEQGYVRGYHREMRKRRAKRAFLGGVIGAALLTMVYAAVATESPSP
jgi:hypothetical protein